MGSTRPRRVTSPVMAPDGDAGEGGNHGRGDGHAGGGAVLGHCALREVDVDVLFLVEVRVDPQLGHPAADIGEGRPCGLLHHVAQVAGQLHLAGAGDHVGLGLQQGPAHGGPGQAVDQAHLILQAVLLRVILPGTQEFFQVVPGHMGLLVLLGDDAHGSFSAQGSDLPLQHTDAGLTGVGHDGLPDGRVGHPHLALL